MKSRNGSLHEYILAKVHNPLFGYLYLRIERARENKDSKGHPAITSQQRDASSTLAWAVGQNPYPHQPWETPREMRKWCFPTTEDLGEPTAGAAYDFVRVYKVSNFHPFKDIEIESCDIHQDPLPLSHLAILTQIVHGKEECYNLFYSQRHWFAYIISRVITQTRSCLIPPQPSDLGNVDHYYHLGSRTYIPIDARFARVEIVTIMEQMFVDSCEKFEREVR